MNTYGNWQNHQEIAARAFDRSMARAQAVHDAQGPPEESGCEEECEDCDGKGYTQFQLPSGAKEPVQCEICFGIGKLFHHKWRRLPGEASDGTTFSKCRRCGLEAES